MKPEIHPQVRQVIYLDTVTKAYFKVASTAKAEGNITIDGVEYPLIKTDVSSASHPFYTGQQRILDTAGRVEKFGNKFGNKVGGITSLLKKKT